MAHLNSASRFKFLTLISFSILLSSWHSALCASDTRLSIAKHHGFEQFRYSLQKLVDNEGEKCKSHHFFIAPYPIDQSYTYMFWREGRTLWILEIGDGSSNHWETVISDPPSGNRISLDRDVVDEPGTSTYLVDSTWVKKIVYDAVLNGDLIVIERKPQS